MTKSGFAGLIAFLTISTTAAAQVPASEYVARRNALAASVKDGIVIALGSPEPEQDYIAFNQNSPFIYLTGFLEPDAALVMVVKNGAISGTPMLFVMPSDPSREVWTGHRLGVPNVKSAFGLDGRDAATLPAVLDSLIGANASTPLEVVGSYGAGDRV